MNKYAIILIFLIMIFAPVEANTLTVCDVGCDYRWISSAYSHTNDYDIIKVYENTNGYDDYVFINKPITILGVGKPFIYNSDDSEAIFSLSNTDDVYISNLSLESYNYEAMNLNHVNNSIFKNLEINTTSYDCNYIKNSNNNLFSHLNITNCEYTGLFFTTNSNNNIITSNNIQNTEEGVYIYLSSYNLVEYNNISNSLNGIKIYDKTEKNIFYHNILKNNIINLYDDELKNGNINTNFYINNEWDDYNFDNEGCIDNNEDGYCDYPYTQYNTIVDYNPIYIGNNKNMTSFNLLNIKDILIYLFLLISIFVFYIDVFKTERYKLPSTILFITYILMIMLWFINVYIQLTNIIIFTIFFYILIAMKTMINRLL